MSELGLVTPGGKVVWGKYAQVGAPSMLLPCTLLPLKLPPCMRMPCRACSLSAHANAHCPCGLFSQPLSSLPRYSLVSAGDQQP